MPTRGHYLKAVEAKNMCLVTLSSQKVTKIFCHETKWIAKKNTSYPGSHQVVSVSVLTWESLQLPFLPILNTALNLNYKVRKETILDEWFPISLKDGCAYSCPEKIMWLKNLPRDSISHNTMPNDHLKQTAFLSLIFIDVTFANFKWGFFHVESLSLLNLHVCLCVVGVIF